MNNYYKEKNKEKIMKMIKDNEKVFEFFNDDIRNDKECALKAVCENCFNIEYVGDKLKDDEELGMIAIKEYGQNLMYLGDKLKDNNKIVSRAIKHKVDNLYYASERLQNNIKNLILLKNFHNDDRYTLDNYTDEYNAWYNKKMNILNKLEFEEELLNTIPESLNHSITKAVKF